MAPFFAKNPVYGPSRKQHGLVMSLKGSAKGALSKHPRIEAVATGMWLLGTLQWAKFRRHVLRARGNSIFVEEWEMGMCSLRPVAVLESILERFKPTSVLDVGCGTGGSLSFFVEKGLDAMGVEGSALAISKNRNSERVRRHDLEIPLDLGRRFELVWSFEVAEHLRPEKAETFLDTLTRHSDLVVMSAAPKGQGGDGHFNEQPPEYWIGLMDGRGYRLLQEETERLRGLAANPNSDEHTRALAGNLLVFRRGNPG